MMIERLEAYERRESRPHGSYPSEALKTPRFDCRVMNTGWAQVHEIKQLIPGQALREVVKDGMVYAKA